MIVIGGLKPATRYLIRVFARNMIADSNRTNEILIQTGNVAMQLIYLKHIYFI